MGVLGLLLSSLLAFANKKLWVFEDPRIDEVESLLPATNCGACGSAGCRPFAEALIEGKVAPALCTVSSADNITEIADYLGVDSGDVVKRVARLACAGGSHVARMRAHYDGLASCRAAAVVSGGPKGCTWGCLGLADCAEVCEFDAITMDKHGLPVVESAKCTACEDCVEVCPKGLFSIQPVDHRLWVACKNLEHGDTAENDCEVACTACERCVKDSPEGLITIDDNLAIIDYSKNGLASRVATERCPTGAIVWLDDDRGVIKGTQAKRIIRKEALPI
ncbi:MAG: RnfABCDGE type electron transport complex subunit B [Candidatus Thiodiazotropha sp. (ex Myrtea sp. 'scaly one' KF741663)]|nr:RnfABCDGE type electron transport complex subunit B [Candidatus Thiodiazotropha sp. (ex Myrtea sp. 'scaly one' KF741663)]